MRVGAFLFAILAFLAQPAAAASSPTMSSLEQQLSAMAANSSADMGIAALDLRTGETVSIKGNTPFPMASTVKVAVAALYLAQVDHGRRSLDDTIKGIPARKLMARMLIHSDYFDFFTGKTGPTAVEPMPSSRASCSFQYTSKLTPPVHP